MARDIPHIAPRWVSPRGVSTGAAALASATIAAFELVWLEPELAAAFPLHHVAAIAASILASVVVGLLVTRRLGPRGAAAATFAVGYSLPLVALLVLNLSRIHSAMWIETAIGVLGTFRFHLVALPYALAGALLFGIGAANDGRCDGGDRTTAHTGGLLVLVGVICGAWLFSYPGGEVAPTGVWVLAALVAASVGAGLGGAAVGVARRRALRAFLRRVRADEVEGWRIREESEHEGMLERRIVRGVEAYRGADSYEARGRVTLE